MSVFKLDFSSGFLDGPLLGDIKPQIPIKKPFKLDFSSGFGGGFKLPGLGNIKPHLQLDEPLLDDPLDSITINPGLGNIKPQIPIKKPFKLDFSGVKVPGFKDFNLKDAVTRNLKTNDADFDIGASLKEKIETEGLIPDFTMPSFNLGTTFSGASQTSSKNTPEKPVEKPVEKLPEKKKETEPLVKLHSVGREQIGFRLPQPWARNRDRANPLVDTPDGISESSSLFTPFNIGIAVVLAGAMAYAYRNRIRTT